MAEKKENQNEEKKYESKGIARDVLESIKDYAKIGVVALAIGGAIFGAYKLGMSGIKNRPAYQRTETKNVEYYNSFDDKGVQVIGDEYKKGMEITTEKPTEIKVIVSNNDGKIKITDGAP